jgi:hypothetical protein
MDMDQWFPNFFGITEHFGPKIFFAQQDSKISSQVLCVYNKKIEKDETV